MVPQIECLRSWIGQTEMRTETVTRTLVERFNATFDQVSDVMEGAEAPFMIHLCLARPCTQASELGNDGNAAICGFVPPVPLLRQKYAGGSFNFHGALRVGDVVTRTSTISDIGLVQGRCGTQCYITVDHTIECNHREIVTERQNIVYYDPSDAPRTTSIASRAAHGEQQLHIEPSAPLLFRYSALTFDSHRVHYDANYTRGGACQRGLLVQDQLQVTLLAQFAQRLSGRQPSHLTFRSALPLWDDSTFTLNATEETGSLHLWTARIDGPTAMEAKATW